MEYIKGYKSFEKDLMTLNGLKFEIGKPMHIDGNIKAGPIDGNGFHLCLNFEDTFRYVEEPILCEAIGFGKISKEYYDDYNGYYNIYACSDMIVKRIIEREEILEMACNISEERQERFIKTYKMTDNEIEYFEKSIKNNYLRKYIDYYQRNDREAFNVKY